MKVCNSSVKYEEKIEARADENDENLFLSVTTQWQKGYL